MSTPALALVPVLVDDRPSPAAGTRSLDAELYFYGKIFGFSPAVPIEPVEIRNLP